MSTIKSAKQYGCKGDLAPLMRDFISVKVASGLKYARQAYVLDRFSKFACQRFGEHFSLNNEVFYSWRLQIAPLKPYTQVHLLYPLRDFSQYLNDIGCKVQIPIIPIALPSTYIPYVFTGEELARFFNVCDNPETIDNCLSTLPRCFPIICRILAGCGMRISEVLLLRLQDVDIEKNILRIINAKNGKERFVPIDTTLNELCRCYIAKYCFHYYPEDYLFQTAKGKPFNESTIHERFKRVLAACGIEHKGRGFGPRIHDFRHTFAVNASRKAYLSGIDMNYFLPVLAVYLGHENIYGTEKYLHLPFQYYDELRETVSTYTKDVIPEVQI